MAKPRNENIGREGITQDTARPAAKTPAPAAKAAVPAAKKAGPVKVPARPVASKADVVAPERTDALITALRGALRKTYGNSAVPTATDAKKLLSVIPCPFPFEFMFGTNGLAMGQVIELMAPPGSGKTALLADMADWFIRGSGGVFIPVENESRLDINWINSFLAPEHHDTWQPLQSQSLDDCQSLVVATIQHYQSLCMLGAKGKKERKSFDSPPLLLAVDSITGKSSKELGDRVIGATIEKGVGKGVLREGGREAVGRVHAIDAKLLANFFRAFSTAMTGWPVVFVAINQLRLEEKPGVYVPIKKKAGGVQINFAKNYGIELYRGASIKSRDCEGVQVRIKLDKSVGGSDTRQILTRMIWWYEQDPETGDAVKRAQWDWGWATVRLLLDILTGDKFPFAKTNCKKYGIHVALPKGGDPEGAKLAYTDMLGMKPAGALPFTELAAAMLGNEKVLQQLRLALGIVVRPAVTSSYAANMIQRLRRQVQ